MAKKKRSKARALRGLAGSPEEHREAAKYSFDRLTPERIRSLPCSKVGAALLDAGALMCESRYSGERDDEVWRRIATLLERARACGVDD